MRYSNSYRKITEFQSNNTEKQTCTIEKYFIIIYHIKKRYEAVGNNILGECRKKRHKPIHTSATNKEKRKKVVPRESRFLYLFKSSFCSPTLALPNTF